MLLSLALFCMCRDLGVRIWPFYAKDVVINKSLLFGQVRLCHALGVGLWYLVKQEADIKLGRLFGRVYTIKMIKIQTHRASWSWCSVICIWNKCWGSMLGYNSLRQGLIQSRCFEGFRRLGLLMEIMFVWW